MTQQNLDLAQLISMLIEEEGLSPQDAAKVAAATMRTVNKQSGLQRSQQSSSRNRDEHEETPQQAKERWIREETEDPNGLFSAGGSTAGGVFGDSVVACDFIDPGSLQRGIGVQAHLRGLQNQQEMIRLLENLQRPAPAPPPAQLEDGRGLRRLLGRKKR